MKLLVLDDEESIVKLITRMFKLRGFETFGATTAESALEIFKAEQPEICLLDIFLEDSEKNGIDVLREIKEINKDTQCIMITRMTDDSFIKQANELGIYDYIVKPLLPDNLKEVIDSVKKDVEEKAHG